MSVPRVLHTMALLLLQEGFPGAASHTVTLREGENLNLHCALGTLSNSSSALQWSDPRGFTIFLNAQRVLRDQRYKLLRYSKEELSIQLPNVTVQDEGVYKCFHYIRHVESLSQEVEILAAPSHPVLEVSPDAERGIRLSCSTQGCKPQPQISWLLDNGIELPGDTRHQLGADGKKWSTSSTLRVLSYSPQVTASCVIRHPALQGGTLRAAFPFQDLPSTGSKQPIRLSEDVEIPSPTENLAIPSPTENPAVPNPSASPKYSAVPSPSASPQDPAISNPSASPKYSAVPKLSVSPKDPAVPSPSASPEIPAVPNPSESPKYSAAPNPSASPKDPAVPNSSACPKVPTVPNPSASPEIPAVPSPSASPQDPAISNPSASRKAPAVPNPSAYPEIPAVPSLSEIPAIPSPSASPKAPAVPSSAPAPAQPNLPAAVTPDGPEGTPAADSGVSLSYDDFNGTEGAPGGNGTGEELPRTEAPAAHENRTVISNLTLEQNPQSKGLVKKQKNLLLPILVAALIFVLLLIVLLFVLKLKKAHGVWRRENDISEQTLESYKSRSNEDSPGHEKNGQAVNPKSNMQYVTEGYVETPEKNLETPEKNMESPEKNPGDKNIVISEKMFKCGKETDV